MIGIIGAMEEEVAGLAAKMEQKETVTFASMCFYKGELAGKDAVVVRSGIGKVNMGICAQILVDRFGVDVLINTGVAGSLDAKINIGDIVIGTDALYHDMDASVFGDPIGQVPRMDVYSFPCDERLSALAEKVNGEVNPEIGTHRGRIVTGDKVIGLDEDRTRLVKDFGGMCCEMEGAAMAHAAYLNQIPCIIIRAISDKADHSMMVDYETFEKQAISHTVRLLMAFITQV